MTNASSKPRSLRIRTYQVGFGDCFLLTFRYAEEERHVLIDFGTTGTPEGNDKELLAAVGENIKEATGGKLNAVVVTHRHRDHIRGFSTETKDGAAGKIIRALKPDLITQPWTEDPEAPKDATSALPLSTGGKKKFSPASRYMCSLDTMNTLASQMVQSANTFLLTAAHDELRFIGEDNLKNVSAVKNLQDMGKHARFGSEYVSYGSKSNLAAKVLPGVGVKILGPPTIEQHKAVATETSKNAEFWMLHQQFWTDQANARLLDKNKRKDSGQRVAADLTNVPIWARWFVRKARSVNASEALSLVRILDDAMNNTSVILMFTIGSSCFLFPGDAQIENWEYALKFAPDKDSNLEAFRKVTVLKVGHHGSRNATPKTLFREIIQGRKATDRPQFVMSTMPGKHGHKENHSEVPRGTLVKEMRKVGNLRSTADLPNKTRFFDEEYPL